MQFFYFILASVLLTVAPGPDILYLLAKSLAHGAKQGIVLAAGLCSGLVVHTALVACGVAAIVSGSPVLFQALKYAGAAYLLYLAWLSLHENGGLSLDAAQDQRSLWQLYRRGVFMNILNPKVILFFLAFLPQFVRADAGAVSLQIALLGAVFGMQAFCVFAFVAVLAGLIRSRILSISNIAKKLGWVQAAVLFCIAAALVI